MIHHIINDTYTIQIWAFILCVLFTMAWGFVLGGVIFYQIGRVRGYTLAANDAMRKIKIRGLLNDDPIQDIARKSGAKIRGDTTAKD